MSKLKCIVQFSTLQVQYDIECVFKNKRLLIKKKNKEAIRFFMSFTQKLKKKHQPHKKLLQATEMKILCKITRRSLLDREKNISIMHMVNEKLKIEPMTLKRTEWSYKK